jgi:outer membrane protein assembly factor BamB
MMTNQLLVPTTGIGEFSYISCEGNKLFYTSDTDTVICCDMNGKQIWRFKDISLLRSPRVVVVSNQGVVFVAGENSDNIVAISLDGNSAKEVYQISGPKAMCYDKNHDTILVYNTENKAFSFQIE